jgi:predicted PurR-regulated permease PerM
MDDAGQRLSRLFLTQIALNAGFGLVIGTGLWFIGVPSAPLWGMLAMMHEAGTTNRPILQSAQRLSGG